MRKNEVVPATEPCDLVFPAEFAAAVTAAQKEKAVDVKYRGPCVNDTDGDGNCHKCHRRGGCAANGGPVQSLPIDSEATIGRLLRRLNLMCVQAVKANEDEHARTAALFSRAVEEAMKFAGIE